MKGERHHGVPHGAAIAVRRGRRATRCRRTVQEGDSGVVVRFGDAARRLILEVLMSSAVTTTLGGRHEPRRRAVKV